MTTLLAVYTSDGCVGRCDAKCYDAAGGECDCICGGKNHGAGRQLAMSNVREYAEKMIAEHRQRHGLESADYLVNAETRQGGLFDS